MKKHARIALWTILFLGLISADTMVKAQLYTFTSNLTGIPSYVNPNLNASLVKRKFGAHGTGGLCPIGFSAKDFTLAGSYAITDPNVQVKLRPQPFVSMNIQSVTVSMRINDKGPVFVRPAYSIDNGVTWVDAGFDFTPVISFCGGDVYTDTWDIPDFTTSTPMILRFYGYSATGDNGTLQIADLVIDGTLNLTDVDGDGYGIFIDCDDNNPLVHPGAVDLCNDIDEDCDGDFDEVDAPISPTGEIFLCKHEEVTLSVPDEFETYLWYKNGSPVPALNTASISTDKPGYYQCYITSGACDGFTAVQAVAVNENPFANIYYPEGLDLCVDDSVKLKASFGIGYSWQWFKNGVFIPGANFYKMLALTPGDYYCQVTTVFGCTRNTDTVTVTSDCRIAADAALTNTNLSVYPNPAEDIFSISLHAEDLNASEADVQIFSVTGAEVFTATYVLNNGGLDQQVNLSDALSNGIYLVRVKVGSAEYTTQLMINK